MESGEPRTAELRPETRESCRVLVVEDNLDSARTLSDLLAIWGHQVRIAYEGPAALETALAFRPDVALVDIGLPGMNGYLNWPACSALSRHSKRPCSWP